MKRSLVSLFVSTVLILATFSFNAPAQAASEQGGPFGLGLVLGDPTAITGKYNLDQQNGVDMGISFNLSKWFLVYGDWLHHFPGAFGNRERFLSELAPYVGVGGVLVFSSQDEAKTRKERYFDESSSSKMALGVRIPLGIEWRTPRVPLGVFIELAPGITVVPATNSFFHGGIGVRYFF